MQESSGNFFGGRAWKRNIYTGLGLSILLVMLLFSLSRVGFYLINLRYFSDMTIDRFLVILAGGLRFDLTAVLYINSLFILLLILPFSFRFHPRFQKTVRGIFIITNGFALATNVADSIYYRFTLRRTTLQVLKQFENEHNWGALIFHFIIDYWYALILWVILMAGLVYLYDRIKFEEPPQKNKMSFYGMTILMLVAVVGLFVVGTRSGFSKRPPLDIMHAGAYAGLPKDIGLVLNTPFTLMKSERAGTINRVDYFASEAALRKAFDPVKDPHNTGPFNPANVVVIILESFSKEFIGAYNVRDQNNKTGYTPFLDSLIALSRVYQYSMANGMKSIDAMPSVICSIPSFEEPYVLSAYATDKFNSTPGLLKGKGYYSAYFHGGANGTMGFEAFANLCGFDDYFGKNEYGHDEDFDGTWGIWDEKFLHFFAQKINSFQQPFYAVVHTVSSHHPFSIPTEYENKFKGGPEPILKTIEYTDYSLRKFFETASKMPWFANTLFVITADHGFNWGNYSIPLFFYKPESNWSFFKPEVVQQIDIMPTILGYLNYDRPYFSFGRDVFKGVEEPFTFHFPHNTYWAYKRDHLLIFDGLKSTALYNFKTDPALQNNLLALSDTVASIEIKIKGLIQQYNNRMIDNKLTVEGSQTETTMH